MDCTSSVLRRLHEEILIWSNKMWFHCSKCLGPFRNATDFRRTGKF
jgi:hypothetical protein